MPGRRNIRRVCVEEAAAVRKAEDDWSKLCISIEDMELTSEEAPTEEVRKSEEFDRRNIRRVTIVKKGSLVSSSSLRRTDSSTETEDFVEEASAVEELAEAAAVRKAEEDWSMEGEQDGQLEEWTRKELKEECRNVGLSDRGKKAQLIERITKAKAATVGASPTEEAVAPVEEIVVIEETEAFVEEAPVVEELAEATTVRKAEEDWSKLCKFIEEMELAGEDSPTEEAVVETETQAPEKTEVDKNDPLEKCRTLGL